MSELALNGPEGFGFMTVDSERLGEWLASNVRPLYGSITLDFEASGLHVDGNWATAAAKCEPEARVSIAAMSWMDADTHTIMSVAIPFDQGFVGGKKGRYIGKVTKKTPTLGWETLPHTDDCERHTDTYSGLVEGITPKCVCAPWNFGQVGWHDLKAFWKSSTVKSIDYFNFKYDAWIALAGLRPTEGTPCWRTVPGGGPCEGWNHNATCGNGGIDLSTKLGDDVMIWEAIRTPAEKISLDAVARRFFGETKDTGMDDGLKANGVGLTKRYDLVDWRTAGRYAAKDTELTLRAKRYHRAMVEAGEFDDRDFPIIKREHRKAVVLFKMEQRGVAFDVDLCREQATAMHKEVDSLVGDLPFEDNAGAAGRYFFGPAKDGETTLGLLPIKLTPGGQPSCDNESVARLTHEPGKPGEVAKLWQHIANMKSVCSKWYDAWPHRAGADGRLRTTFWQFATEDTTRAGNAGGAISARLAASRIQLQGVPQAWRIPEGIVGIKKLFRARRGHQVWSFDASNAEVRVTAWLTRCQALADVINSGVNIHSANTVNIFGAMLASTWEQHKGIPWPEDQPFNVFEDATVPGGWTRDASKAVIDDDGDPVYVLSKHPDWKKVRTSMKRGIFGTIYASGVRTLKSQIDADLKDDIPERQIRGFMDALNGAYPEIKRTSKACERKVDVANGGVGFVRLVSGRRRVFGWGEQTYKALNACVQGGVAEMMSELMIAIEDKYPGMLINQVHDDVWLEIPDDRVDEVKAWVKAEGKRIFESAFNNPGMHIDFKFDSKRLA